MSVKYFPSCLHLLLTLLISSFASPVLADDLFVYNGQDLPSTIANTTVGVDLGDIDGDGDLDAIIANGASVNLAYLNDGAGNFTEMSQQLGAFGYALALGDVENDGDLDVVFGDFAQPLRIWKNDGAGNFSLNEEIENSFYTQDIDLEHLNGDNFLDMFLAQPYDRNRLFFNGGNGEFAAYTTYEESRVRYYASAMEFGDLDGDGDLDVFLAGHSPQSPNVVYFNSGNGRFEFNDDYMGIGAWSVDLGDVDGDGDLDAIVGGYYGTPNRVLLNNGSGVFTDSGQSLGDPAWSAEEVLLADVDLDEDLDLVIASTYRPLVGNEYVHIGYNTLWLNNGNGGFTDSGLNLGFAGLSAAFGDVDGDDDPDLVIGSLHRTVTKNTIWINNTPHDQEPPVLTVPADIVADSTGEFTEIDIGDATAVDNITADPVITNDAPTAFPFGTTVVNWTATDEIGNASSASQFITVLSDSEILYDLGDQFGELDLPAGIQRSLEAKLNSASSALSDENPKNDKAGINSLDALINSIEAQRGKNIEEADADALIARILNLISLWEI